MIPMCPCTLNPYTLNAYTPNPKPYIPLKGTQGAGAEFGVSASGRQVWQASASACLGTQSFRLSSLGALGLMGFGVPRP